MRIRALKPGFFRNETLCELSSWHRLAFAGLWCSADRDGRLEDRPKRLKADIFPYDDLDLDAILWDLAKAGFIIRYAVDGRNYIAIPKWTKHQHPRQDENASTLPPHERGTVRSDGSHGSTSPVSIAAEIVERPVSSAIAGVYFIESNGFVKIGVSSDCNARIARLLRMSPNSRVLGVIRCESIEAAEEREEALHRQFDGDRQNHEWFRLTPDIERLIAADSSPSLNSDATVTAEASPQRMGNGRWEVGDGKWGTPTALSPPATRAACRSADLVELWNATTKPPIPRCREVTEDRRRKIRQRLARRPDLAEWRAIFERIQGSSFCRGDTGSRDGRTPWVADFDWIVRNDTNAAKVLEGKFDDRAAPMLGKQSSRLLQAIANLEG